MMLIVLGTLIVSCSAPVTDQPVPSLVPEARIARYPRADNYRHLNVYSNPPVYNPDSMDSFQMDLRSSNLTELDLSKSKADLLHAMFDNKTKWPESDKMPADFVWQKIMEIGKDPGLGMRALHEQGITGKGVNIAIIDQPLIIDHVEYPNRIRLYEEISVGAGTPSQMHGPAVTSIAVGKTAGVAPDANLYYIATWMFEPEANDQSITYTFYVQAIHRILEINEALPQDQKIRAISMSVGSDPSATDYDEFLFAVEKARAAGIFAIYVNLGYEQMHDWKYLGLGRDPLSDPNDFQSYKPAVGWEQSFYEQGLLPDVLLIPMDSRTTASPTGKEDYVFYSHSGMSWTVPYLAGTYALAAQVKPDITPEEFWGTALSTGRTTQIQHEGKEYDFGVILDPQALIEAIKDK
jgi:hypothetical protein